MTTLFDVRYQMNSSLKDYQPNEGIKNNSQLGGLRDLNNFSNDDAEVVLTNDTARAGISKFKRHLERAL